MKKVKWLSVAMATIVAIACAIEPADAGKYGSSGRSSFGSSSRSSSSYGSRSSKPSYGSSSKPSYGSSSKPSYGSSSKPSSSRSSAPSSLFGGSKSSKPSSANPTTSSKPKYGSGSSGSSSSTSPKKPKYGSSSGTKYVESPKATRPPVSNYTSRSGKTVKVDSNSKVAKTIRSNPSSDYTPQQRESRSVIHTHIYHYNHDYGYYHSRPYYYVGGGYSSAFWWMMMEWDAQRRARWLYNNQASIEQQAYQEGMKDAQVAAEIAKLKAQNTPVDPNYIDPEFEKSPDLMYSQEYVNAVYNPEVVPESTGSAWGIVWGIIVFLLVGGIVFYIVFVKRWN